MTVNYVNGLRNNDYLNQAQIKNVFYLSLKNC